MTTGYPQRLQALLQARYTGDTYVVTNAGVAGELAVFGQARLPGVIIDATDLVIILEGVNDTIPVPSDSTIISALRAMVVIAKDAGKRVLLCTLLPDAPIVTERTLQG